MEVRRGICNHLRLRWQPQPERPMRTFTDTAGTSGANILLWVMRVSIVAVLFRSVIVQSSD